MGTVTININDQIEDSFRNFVYKNYGKSKGILIKTITEALENWIKKTRKDLKRSNRNNGKRILYGQDKSKKQR